MRKVQKGCRCHDFHKVKSLVSSRASQLKSQGTQRSKEYFLQLFIFFLAKEVEPPRAEALTVDYACKLLLHCLASLFPQTHKSTIASPSLHCLPGAKPRSPLSQNGACLSFHWTTAPFLYVTVCVLAINNTIHAFKIRNNVIKNYSDFQEKAIF